MIDVQTTAGFDQWLADLRDREAAAIVTARIFRLRRGLLGDVKHIGSGVSELRINCGPGYRVYFVYRGRTMVLLLCGGDKSTQSSDISVAKAAAANIANPH